jgi:hypothetical protein
MCTPCIMVTNCHHLKILLSAVYNEFGATFEYWAWNTYKVCIYAEGPALCGYLSRKENESQADFKKPTTPTADF